MNQEYRPLDEEIEEPLVDFPREINEDQLPPPPTTELEIIRRRELAVQATDAIAEVLDEQVTVPELMRQADIPQATPRRLRARRALRCIYDIGVEDSPVVAAVGEINLYHYVEGVVQYGCDRNTYLGLMEAFDLTAEQVTGLYALRELIAEEGNDTRIGFANLQRALAKVNISMHQAADDPDSALSAFNDAGFFVNYNNGHIYDRPVFSTSRSKKEERLGRHIDNVGGGAVQFAWIRDYVQDLGINLNEDKEVE